MAWSSRNPYLLYSVFFWCFIFLTSPADAVESRKIEKLIEDTQPTGSRDASSRERQKLLETGKTYYARFCIYCHGDQGRGKGVASHYLFPPPRNLSRGVFKFHSTQSNSLPLDSDLFRTIRMGIPGTPMPAWGKVFSDEGIRALVAYIKTFSGRFDREIPDYRVEAGLEIPFDGYSLNEGKDLYRQLRCGRCHGEEGDREGPLEDQLRDIWGNTSFVYDLRQPARYKAGSGADDIYKMLVAGINGTPMNTYDYLTNAERWHLVHYLQSRFIPEDPARPPPARINQLVSVAIDGPIDLAPDSAIWDNTPPVGIRLVPVRTRKRLLDAITVQSVRNQTQIAFRLRWKDPSADGAARGFSQYLDAAAIQFSLGRPDPLNSPFFGMGDRDHPVNIWHWKADSNQKIKNAVASNIDSSKTSGLLVNPFTESGVEEINSWGFGSLLVQSLEDQQVFGEGRWLDGHWTVVFARDLKTPGRYDVNFKEGNRFLLAFALWDGSSKDKNAHKLVSFWQTLLLK